MASSTAIGDVGESLVDLLKDRMTDLNLGDLDDKVALASPNDVGDGGAGKDLVLSLFLYRVEENAHAKNATPASSSVDDLETSTLTLDLYYLLTAYPTESVSGLSAESAGQHRVLGRAMQVFYDNPVLRGSDLRGSLVGEAEVSISQYPEPADGVVSIWNTFQDQPYQPSVAYLASPVEIDSTRETERQRVVERTVRTYERDPGGAGR